MVGDRRRRVHGRGFGCRRGVHLKSFSVRCVVVREDRSRLEYLSPTCTATFQMSAAHSLEAIGILTVLRVMVIVVILTANHRSRSGPIKRFVLCNGANDG